MGKMIFRRFEPLWMHSLNEILDKFILGRNISIMDSYKLARKRKMKTPSESLNARIFYSAGAIALELLVLALETYQREGIDYSLPEINNMLREIKSFLPPEFRSMNGEEFLKLLRGSIAHNSESTQNVSSYNFEKYEVNLPKKGASPVKKEFTSAEILTILNSFDKSRILTKHYGCLDTREIFTSADQFLKAAKKYHSFSEFIKFTDAKGREVPIDEYQERAFTRFLIKHKENINKLGNFDHFMGRYFPAKENKINHYEMKFQLLLGLGYINDYDYNQTTCQKLLKYVKEKNFGGTLLFMDRELMKSLLYSSIVFNIVSSRTNEELKDIFSNAGYVVEDEKVRHIRNSFIHGRYFYNYKEGFELYDGISEMEHITTINFADIEKILDYYSKNERYLHENDEADYLLVRFEERE